MHSGRTLISRCCIGFALVASAQFAQFAQADTWGLIQLMSSFAEIRESRARFTEEKQLSMLTEPLRLSGTLRYVRPNQLEKSVTLPHSESLRVDGDRIEWQREKRTRVLSLRSQPQIWALVDSIRATLAGDLPRLELHYVVKFEGEKNQWKILLTPRDPSLAKFIELIRLDGKSNHLRRVEIVEANNDRSVLLIEEARD